MLLNPGLERRAFPNEISMPLSFHKCFYLMKKRIRCRFGQWRVGPRKLRIYCDRADIHAVVGADGQTCEWSFTIGLNEQIDHRYVIFRYKPVARITWRADGLGGLCYRVSRFVYDDGQKKVTFDELDWVDTGSDYLAVNAVVKILMGCIYT